MNAQTWIEHIETTTGLTRPSAGGNKETWMAALAQHRLDGCEACAARRRTRKATIARQTREQAYLDAGLVKGRTGLGRIIWE